MYLRAAAELVLPHVTDAAVIFANGYISRAGHALGDRPGHFYMIGSMGLAAAIGLGIAIGQPRRRVVVLDGDGNVLMNLGELATAAALRPANFHHVVFDNGVYASTGNQPTLSDTIDLAAVARAAGYAHAARVENAPELQAALPRFFATPGPGFLLVKIDREEGTPFGRVAIEPSVMAARLRAFLAPRASGEGGGGI
jgi:thiamine pyrophosphate-dependent acetolactate synthase large subunit-like protein